MAEDAPKPTTQDIQRARYEFKRQLEEIRGIKGRGTELVSVYVSPDRSLVDVTNQLRGELGQAQNIKSKTTRKNVSAALESALSRLKQFRKTPEKGVVVFVGHKPVGGDQTRMVGYVLLPPEAVPINTYRCDSRFFIEPLEGMLKEHDVYGLVVVDRGEATIGFLRGPRIELVKNMQSMVPRKHTKGGQSAKRFERLIEEAAHHYFVKVADSCNEIFMAEPELKGILVGGPGYTKEEFLGENNLHYELRKKVVGTFDVGYTDEYGLRELVENAKEALRERGLGREKELMQKFLTELRHEAGLVAYGEADVRQTLELGAVMTLLLSEKLRRWRVRLQCPNGHPGRDETTSDVAALQDDPPTCATCNARLEITQERDVVDELTQLTDKMGGTVEILSEASEEGELLWTAFGGIAALLRFRPG